MTTAYGSNVVTAISDTVNVSIEGSARGELSDVATIFLIVGVNAAIFGIVMAIYFGMRRRKSK